MKLIIMTKSTFFVEEDKILTTLFEAGMSALHLNKRDTEPIYSERLLTLLPDEYYNRIIVHNHFYLKEEFRLKGIHLDNCQTEPPAGYKRNVSRTCNAISELKEAKKSSNYVFLRSIFDSQSNREHKATLTIGELEQASAQGLIDKRVYALGGMNLDNIRIAKELGFGGVVICGDLWNRFDITGGLDYKALISHFEKLRKAVS